MCEALVQRNPCATNRNSPANRTATTNPERHQTLGNHTSRMIHFPISQTKTAATPERTATCMIGAMSPATAFIATCWPPQIRHSSTITAVAAPSTDFLTYGPFLSLMICRQTTLPGQSALSFPLKIEIRSALLRNSIVEKYASRYKSCVFDL